MNILEIIGAIYIGLTIVGVVLFLYCIINAKEYKDNNIKNIEENGTKERNERSTKA